MIVFTLGIPERKSGRSCAVVFIETSSKAVAGCHSPVADSGSDGIACRVALARERLAKTVTLEHLPGWEEA